MAFWYLFDSTIREVGSINIALGYSLLNITGKRLDKEKLTLITLTNLISEALVMHGIKIMANFNDMTHLIELGKAQWYDLLSRTWGLVCRQEEN